MQMPLQPGESFDIEPPRVIPRLADGTLRPGIRVLGGEVGFDTDCAYDPVVQLVACYAMIGATNSQIGNLIPANLLPHRLSEEQVKSRLEKISRGIPRHGLLGKLVSQPEPGMSVVRRIKPEYLPFTKREAEVDHLIALGLHNREIAARLDISPATVKTYVQRWLPEHARSLRGKELLGAAYILRDVPGKDLPARGLDAIPLPADVVVLRTPTPKPVREPKVRISPDGRPWTPRGECQNLVLAALANHDSIETRLLIKGLLGDHPDASIRSALAALQRKGFAVKDGNTMQITAEGAAHLAGLGE